MLLMRLKRNHFRVKEYFLLWLESLLLLFFFFFFISNILSLNCLLTWGSPGRPGTPSLQYHYPDPSTGNVHRPANCAYTP